MPLILALRRQMQVDLFEFEVSLVYRVSPNTATAVIEKPCLKNKTKTQKLKPNKKTTHILLLCFCLCYFTP